MTDWIKYLSTFKWAQLSNDSQAEPDQFDDSYNTQSNAEAQQTADIWQVVNPEMQKNPKSISSTCSYTVFMFPNALAFKLYIFNIFNLNFTTFSLKYAPVLCYMLCILR